MYDKAWGRHPLKQYAGNCRIRSRDVLLVKWAFMVMAGSLWDLMGPMAEPLSEAPATVICGTHNWLSGSLVGWLITGWLTPKLATRKNVKVTFILMTGSTNYWLSHSLSDWLCDLLSEWITG
jgi:hypothetical protein